MEQTLLSVALAVFPSHWLTFHVPHFRPASAEWRYFHDIASCCLRLTAWLFVLSAPPRPASHAIRSADPSLHERYPMRPGVRWRNSWSACAWCMEFLNWSCTRHDS